MSDDQNANPPATTQEAPTDNAPANTDTVDWKAEAEKWKSLSRKHETSWKATSDELNSIKAQTMTESERAIEAAKAEGRSSALSEVRGQLGEAALRTAAATAGVQLPEALSGLIDASKFVNDDGTANADLITSIVNGFAASKPPAFSQSTGIGQQSSQAVPGQITREQLATMTSAQITKAKKDGLLNHLMHGGS